MWGPSPAANPRNLMRRVVHKTAHPDVVPGYEHADGLRWATSSRGDWWGKRAQTCTMRNNLSIRSVKFEPHTRTFRGRGKPKRRVSISPTSSDATDSLTEVDGASCAESSCFESRAPETWNGGYLDMSWVRKLYTKTPTALRERAERRPPSTDTASSLARHLPKEQDYWPFGCGDKVEFPGGVTARGVRQRMGGIGQESEPSTGCETQGSEGAGGERGSLAELLMRTVESGWSDSESSSETDGNRDDNRVGTIYPRGGFKRQRSSILERYGADMMDVLAERDSKLRNARDWKGIAAVSAPRAGFSFSSSMSTTTAEEAVPRTKQNDLATLKRINLQPQGKGRRRRWNEYDSMQLPPRAATSTSSSDWQVAGSERVASSWEARSLGTPEGSSDFSGIALQPKISDFGEEITAISQMLGKCVAENFGGTALPLQTMPGTKPPQSRCIHGDKTCGEAQSTPLALLQECQCSLKQLLGLLETSSSLPLQPRSLTQVPIETVNGWCGSTTRSTLGPQSSATQHGTKKRGAFDTGFLGGRSPTREGKALFSKAGSPKHGWAHTEPQILASMAGGFSTQRMPLKRDSLLSTPSGRLHDSVALVGASTNRSLPNNKPTITESMTFVPQHQLPFGEPMGVRGLSGIDAEVQDWHQQSGIEAGHANQTVPKMELVRLCIARQA